MGKFEREVGPTTQTGWKRRRTVTFPIYKTGATVSNHVDTGIQTYEPNWADHVDVDSGLVDDYVMTGEEEIA